MSQNIFLKKNLQKSFWRNFFISVGGSFLKTIRLAKSEFGRAYSRQELLKKPSPTNSLEKRIEFLNNYHRSNQDTCLVHKPRVQPGEWVESGDLIADSSASMGGELAIGKNILVAYMPWEGYNFEDAILINERLVFDDVYTSIHIERYEIETKESSMGSEQITRQIPEISPEAISHLDSYGIASIGSWIEEGDILVGKVTPIKKKTQTPYQSLLFKLLEKKINTVRDSSLRAPRGMKANVIKVQILGVGVNPPEATNGKKKRKVVQAKNKKDSKNLANLPNNNKQTKDGELIQNISKASKAPKGDLSFTKSQPPLGTDLAKATRLSNKSPNLKGSFAQAPKTALRPPAFLTAKLRSKGPYFSRDKSGGLKEQGYPPFKKFSLAKIFDHNPPNHGPEAYNRQEVKSVGQAIHIRSIAWQADTTIIYNLLNYLTKLKSLSSNLTFMVRKPNNSLVLPILFQKSLDNALNVLRPPAFSRKGFFYNSKSLKKLEKALVYFSKTPIQALLGAYYLLHSYPSSADSSNKRRKKKPNLFLLKTTLENKSLAPIGAVKYGQTPNNFYLLKRRKIDNGSAVSGSRGQAPSGYELTANTAALYNKKETKLQNSSLTKVTQAISQKKQKKIPTLVHIYLAEKRKIQVGDKMAGRHGNKGIISNILPRQDMPYLPDGTALDIVLNPLGVPSRMNVGQIYECLLGLAGKYLGEHYKIYPFDEIFGAEASRSFVFAKLFEARKKLGLEWLFDPDSPGKIRLIDGRSGECFDQPVTVGVAYMLKLVHMVDDKIHMRSTGPYSLVTQQPLRGRAKQGGQRLGEMEVWAIEGYGAAFVLLEMLTIKSDDMTGRLTLWSNLILNKDITVGTPESFKVLVCELQALCLDIGLYHVIDNASNAEAANKSETFSVNGTKLKEVSHLMLLP